MNTSAHPFDSPIPTNHPKNSTEKKPVPLLTSQQQKSLYIAALLKIAACFQELSQLCLEQTDHRTRPEKIGLKIDDSRSHLSRLELRYQISLVKQRKSTGLRSEVRTKRINELKCLFNDFKIKMPKAPVSAYYLFYTLQSRQLRLQTGQSLKIKKSDFTSLWNKLSPHQKQPFQFLSAEILSNYWTHPRKQSGPNGKSKRKIARASKESKGQTNGLINGKSESPFQQQISESDNAIDDIFSDSLLCDIDEDINSHEQAPFRSPQPQEKEKEENQWRSVGESQNINHQQSELSVRRAVQI